MQITINQENRTSIITLQGELDACSSIPFDNAFSTVLNNQPERICVDCGQLEYISSAGLGVIVSYLQELQNRSIPLVLFSPQGLDRYIHVSPNRETALRYAGAQTEVA